ncbi:MAG: DinB family protein [Chloroflexi bacterium]|nr:DinB family protein [Chloroflexota bacterium]
MQTFFQEYLNVLQICHTDILKELDGLPPAALDWTPGIYMNSVSVLVFHLTGAERYWIGDVAAQDTTERDREAEFRVHGVGVDVLKKRLADNLEYARAVLEKFTIQDLEKMRPARGGREFSVAWALLHALEHSTLHLGQIQLTRQLWEQSKSSI